MLVLRWSGFFVSVTRGLVNTNPNSGLLNITLVIFHKVILFGSSLNKPSDDNAVQNLIGKMIAENQGWCFKDRHASQTDTGTITKPAKKCTRYSTQKNPYMVELLRHNLFLEDSSEIKFILSLIPGQ